ncbi:hypothetical protein GCM10028786_32100 [Flaviaesturariibacter terrae]
MLFLFASRAGAQTSSADGYVLLPAGDTLRCHILLPNSFSFSESDKSFADGVTVEAGGTSHHYNPNEMLGFGLRQRRIEAHYRSLVLPGTTTVLLARALRLGRSLNLYFVPHTHGRTLATDRPMLGHIGDLPLSALLLQDRSGNIVLLENTMPRSELRAALRSFFAADEALRAQAAREVKAFRDLDAFVQAANGPTH